MAPTKTTDRQQQSHAPQQQGQANMTTKPQEQHVAVLYAPRLPYHPYFEKEYSVDKAKWKALVEAIYPNATTSDSVLLALSYCKARGLDIFKRPVHIVPIWSKAEGRMIDSIWPGIGELRATAHRTREYAGHDECVMGPMIEAQVGNVLMKYPEWAQMTVYRLVQGIRCAFPGPKVYWRETYATAKRDDDSPNEMWRNRPIGQIDKCFDEETEVLTEEGFQTFDTVSARILQVCDDGAVPCDAKPFCRDYDGPMVAFETKCLDFCVTPNHDMVTTVGKVEAGVMLREATTVTRWRIPMTIDGGRQEYAITDQEIILAAIIICDGYRHGSQWNVAVSRDRKVERIKEVGGHRGRHIRKCAGDQSEMGSRVVTTRKDKVVFTFDQQAGGDLLTVRDDRKTIDKAVVLQLSKRQAKLFADTMIDFDGSSTPTARRFYSSKDAIMSAFELACVVAGLSVSHRTYRYSDSANANMAVTVSSKQTAPIVNTVRSRIESRGNAGGRVWCCRVPSGVIVVRRNGFSMLCGNCAEAAALRSGFPEELGGDYIPEEIERGAVMGTIHAKPAPDNSQGQNRGSQLVKQLQQQQSPPVVEEVHRPVEQQQERDPGDEGPVDTKTGPLTKAALYARINVATKLEQLEAIKIDIARVEPEDDRVGVMFEVDQREKQINELMAKVPKGQLPLS